MFSGNTVLVEKFDAFVGKKYNQLLNDSKRIFQGNEFFDDSLNDNLLKVRERIARSGYTGNNWYGYVWRSVQNDFKLQKKREARLSIIDADEDWIKDELELAVLDQQHNSQLYLNDLDVLVRYLFKYLDKYYNEQQTFLFKTYFLTEQNTYRKLVANSDYQFQTVKKILSEMKKDVRNNLINYIKFELTPEVFRPVRNYEGLYQISNKGTLKSDRTGAVVKMKRNHYRIWKNNQVKYKSFEQLTINVFRQEDLIRFKRK